tara:strand:- start:22 stop:1479 length:1458 start_codon:yes stop_codon:yes gene_type:complete
MPRTAKTLVFNDPTDNIQITAHRLRSSTDMSLNIDTSHNLHITSDNLILNESNFTLNNPAILSSTLNVNGISTLQDLNAGATDISSTLLVDGAATLSSTLNVTDDATFDTNLTVSGNLIIGDSSSRGGTISGTNNTIIIDPYPGSGDISGNVIIYGNLQIEGTTTTINSNTLDISDLDIRAAKNATIASEANGGGILVGASGQDFAKLTFNSTNNNWRTNIGLDVSGTILGTTITASTKFIGDISSSGQSIFTNVDINGGAIDNTPIGSTTTSSGAFTTLSASEDVTFSQNLDVSGLDVSNNATVGGTLAVTGATTLTGSLTANGGIDVSGNVLPTNLSSHIPVTHNTFSLITTGITDDQTGTLTGWTDATGFDISKTLLSVNSFVKMEFKANFISSPEADQTLSFRVQRSTDGGSFSTIFTDSSLGSNMGVTIRNVYNGTYIDEPGHTIVTYKLQYNRDGTDIDTDFGIVGGGNYIFLQELYVP